ncbi:MAG TPA: hypothetical protein ENI19_03630, partial [Candidatus Nealsonbacteria bacterium]|nr:hypothetical protein [Candidatus Nealsonbacteria bacterium]
MVTHLIIQKSQLEGGLRLDAEYYQPEYLELKNRLCKTESYKFWKDIKGNFITGPFGSEFNVENYVLNGKYRYVRGKDVKEFFLSDDDNVYIPQKDFERLKKYSLKENDILISVVGTLGNAAIIDNSVPPAIFSCKSTVFRSESINPYYFISYLNSLYGRKLLGRNVRGAVQTGLNIDDLRLLPVFIPPKQQQELIGSLVSKAKEEYENTKLFYSQAEDLLLEELGLKDFEVGDDLSYVVNLSDLKLVNRIDAEYFQPKHEKLISKIKNQNIKKLADLVSIKKGIEIGSEKYQKEGKLFVRVSNLSKQGIIDKDQKYLSEELYQKLKKDFEPKAGEILLTKDATPGMAYLLKESIEGIIAGGILRLKPETKI